MSRPFKHADGVFKSIHEAKMGAVPDLSALRAQEWPPALLDRARRAWQERALSEFRSTQILTRFLTEVLGAGDPIEVYGCAVDLVEDEVKHTALCVAVCEALGAPAVLPNPVPLVDPEPYLRAPMPERALHTAIAMLAINETLSVGFIEDLARRCENPPIRAVLDATLGDEAAHREMGWSYVKMGLARFPISTLKDWRHLVSITLKPHEDAAARALERVAPSDRALERFPDHDLIPLGLFSPERQALVFQRTFERELAPRLRELSLLA